MQDAHGKLPTAWWSGVSPSMAAIGRFTSPDTTFPSAAHRDISREWNGSKQKWNFRVTNRVVEGGLAVDGRDRAVHIGAKVHESSHRIPLHAMRR